VKGRWIVIENGHELYSEDVKARVETVFHAASQVSKLTDVLNRIKAEAKNLRKLFFTEKDQKEIQETLHNLDATIQKAHYCISKNLEAYQDSKWSEIMDEEKGE
jgi:C4-type Zn-finger protein